MIRNTNLVNTIHEPTRVTYSTQTLLDPILTSHDVNIAEAGTLNIDSRLSDHKATYITLTVDYRVSKAYERKVWQYKSADLEKLNLLIDEYDWENLFENTSSIDSAVQLFTTQYLSLVRECIPEKTITIRPKDKPWFDSLLRKYIRIRNRLRSKALRTKNDTDWLKYKTIRNKVNNMKKHALQNYYDNINVYINNASKDNNKLYWKLVKDVFQTKLTNEIPPLKYTSANGDTKYVFFRFRKN